MQNEMRDRLVPIVKDSLMKHIGKSCNLAENIVDDLIEHGVIVPPCKVGDTVYVLEDWGYKRELKTKEIGVIVIKGTNDFSKVFWEDVYGGEIGSFADIGKTIFLTKEEAEKALKEGADNG